MRRLPVVVLACAALTVSTGAGVVASGSIASATTSSTPIIVGGDGDVAIAPGIAQGFEAGIYRFNKAGGLDGRKIEFVGFLDDSFSAQTALTNAQELVQDKHVSFLAPVLSDVASGATGTYLAQQKVPFIGWATDAAFATDPQWGFSIDGNQTNPNIQDITVADTLAITGFKKPSQIKEAYIGENIAGAIVSNNALAEASKDAGVDVVYQKSPIAVLGTTSYAPYAQAVIQSGANTVFETLDSNDAIGLAAALHAAGFKGSIINGVTYYPGTLASQPNEASALNGVYIVDDFPSNQNATPAVKQEISDLKSIGAPPNLSSGPSIGYWSAIVLEEMLKATLKSEGGNPNLVTGASLDKMVNKGFTYTDSLAGGVGTEYFPGGAETGPTGCNTVLKTVGTNFKQITPFRCLGALNVVKRKVMNQKTGKLES